MTDFFQSASVASSLGDTTTAYNHIQSALAADPLNADAWHMLGHILSEKTKHWEAAAAAFARANALRPGRASTLVGLGWSLHLSGRDDEAIEHLAHAVAIERTPLALADLAALRIGRHDIDGAIALAKEAVKLGPSLPLAHMVLAFSHFHAGEWLPGFQEYEWRFRYKMPAVLNYPYPLWRGEHVDRLFVQAEQGIGDSLQALRWLHHTRSRARAVTLFVHPELRRLTERAFGNTFEIIPNGSPLPPADAWCPLFSLPVALNIDPLDDLEAFGGAALPQWLPHPKGGIKHIAIAWAGNPAHDAAHMRDVPLSAFLRLAALPNIRLHSMQIGQRAKDINDIGAGGLIADDSLYIGTMQDTAVRLIGMDALIACDTSLAHLGGVIGIPTTLLVNQQAVDWRWRMDGTTTPWYKSMRIARRRRDQSWDSLLASIAAELSNEQAKA